MTKEDDEDFKSSTKSWIWDLSVYVGVDYKVRDHCHTTGKYRNSGYGGCNINVKLIHKFLSYLTI